MDIAFNFRTYRLPADEFDQLEEEPSAVECGKRKQVHHAEIHADNHGKIYQIPHAGFRRFAERLCHTDRSGDTFHAVPPVQEVIQGLPDHFDGRC